MSLQVGLRQTTDGDWGFLGRENPLLMMSWWETVPLKTRKIESRFSLLALKKGLVASLRLYSVAASLLRKD
eukprot:scaffold1474_cov132-Cylindrotheca_fusiformis.AAC.8